MEPVKYQMFLVEVDTVCELWNADHLTDEEAVVSILEIVTRYQQLRV